MQRSDLILEFIRESLLDDSAVEIDEDTSLFDSRFLDSLNLVEILRFLEDEFSVRVSPSEVTLENLDSASRMTALLDRKRAG
jgi:acyl carrier protein